jgi:O-antigen/teichoic acid export membrane protein
MTTAAAAPRSSHTRSIVSFFSGSLAASALSVLATLLVTRWTPPQELGTWNFALLISTYLSALQAGVFNGLNRQLPYYLGRGDTSAFERAANAAHGWGLALSVASAVATLALAAAFALHHEMTNAGTTLAIGAVVSCSWFLQLLTVGYSGTSKFSALARKNAVNAAAGVPMALLAYGLGYAGLLIRAAAMAVLNIVLLGRNRPLKSHPRWDPGALWALGRIGLPIWLIGQLSAAFMTLDRVVLADSSEALGFYSIAAQFGALALMVPTAFNAVHYPQMARTYGASHLARPLWRHAARAALPSAACGLALWVPSWFLIPIFVEHVLPAYAPGIAAARWAALTGVAMAPSIFGNLFNLLGRQDLYLLCSAAGLAAFVSAWYVLTRVLHMPHLVSAAQCMLAGTFVTSMSSALLAFVLCRRHDAARASQGAAQGGGQA